MPLRQIIVPYVRSYDFGIGADLASGSPMGKVVVGSATPVEQAAGAVGDFQVQRIQTTSDLEQALGIDVEMSYGSAAFGAGGSARFSFAKTSKVQSSSLFMAISTQVELAFLSIDDPMLSDDAASLSDRPQVFAERYGNMFVRGIGRGGLFVGVLRVDTGSSEESERISAELSGSYGLFSVDAKANFEEVLRESRSEVFLRMYHEGGPIDLRITDPTDPLQLLNNANLFRQSFESTPAEVARPYFVALAPVTIARGPVPSNAADIQKAQDVLVICAKRRSALIDQFNLLQYIVDNQSKFDFSNGASLSAVRTALRDSQADLDLVAECASNAINNSSDATFPPLFAEARGTTFPKAVMPEPMPVSTAAGTVEVPDFMACPSWAACVELATRTSLVANREEATGITPGAFKVLSITPPKNTRVPEGSAITIVTHPVAPTTSDEMWLFQIESDVVQDLRERIGQLEPIQS